jgi:hypothetical protein
VFKKQAVISEAQAKKSQVNTGFPVNEPLFGLREGRRIVNVTKRYIF